MRKIIAQNAIAPLYVYSFKLILLHMRLRLFFLFFLICPGVFAQSESARKIASSLDDSALVAQVLLTGIDGKARLTPAMRNLLEQVPAGGIMLFRYNLDTSKDDVKKLLAETAALVSAGTGIPPFMAVDLEGGIVHRFGPGVERLPSAYSFWELALEETRYAALSMAETLYRRSALEISELGINMVLGPVAEILTEDNRLFLDTRSYGPDRNFTEEAASAFVRSMSSRGIASAVKHFPGNTSSDPHDGISTIKMEKAALDEMVAPFAGIIRSLKPPALMLSHVMVPALDDRRNASLSRRVIQGWLRWELGFEGIVLADDFSMGAVTALGLSHSAAAVEAFNAGVDMIMVWPKDLVPVHSAIITALRQRRLSRERLVEAASRIITEKIRSGLVTNTGR